jgi:hypothetical protein
VSLEEGAATHACVEWGVAHWCDRATLGWDPNDPGDDEDLCHGEVEHWWESYEIDTGDGNMEWENYTGFACRRHDPTA